MPNLRIPFNWKNNLGHSCCKMKLNLIQKIVLALAAVSVIPLGWVSYRLVGLNRNAMTDQILRTHAVAARTTASRVEAFLSTRYALALTAASNPELHVNPRSPATRELLAGILQSQDDIASVAVCNEEGDEFIRAQRRELAKEINAVLEADQDDSIQTYPGESATWIRIDVPIQEGRDTVRLVCNGTPLAVILEPEELGEQADLILMDRRGGVILGSTDRLDGFPRELIEEARTGRLSGAKRYDGDSGAAVLAAHAPVANSGWAVLSRQPASVAEALSRNTLKQSLIAVGAAFGLVALMSVTAFRTIVKPVQDLIRSQRRLAGVDETQPFGNEIDQLRQSFSILEKRVKDKEDLSKVFLGRYQILDVVGEGMMGTVYRSWDPKLKRQVALKTVRLDGIDIMWNREELVKSLRNEAVTVAQFSHQHIVSVYDLQDTSDAAFIAMEFVDGMSLQDHIREGKRLPYQQVVPLAAAVAEALAAAHVRGIVHHDMKPGNVLLGKDGSIKVSDFGISQLVSTAATGEHLIFGTPGYLPPETLRGKGYDELSDLFALGVLMYRCLTGEKPFGGNDVNQIVASTFKQEVTPPRQHDPSIPKEISEIVMSLMEKDRARRPESAAKVAERLQQLSIRLELQWIPSEQAFGEGHEKDIHAPHICFLPTQPMDDISGIDSPDGPGSG